MEFFVLLVITILLSVASYMLMPKTKMPDQKPATEDQFDYPTAEEGRAIPVVFGTVKYKGTNSLWTGDYKNQKVEF